MTATVELQHLRRAFWRGVRDGLPTVAAARLAGVSGGRGFRWFREAGGVAPVSLAEPVGRYLSLPEREEISRGLAGGDTQAVIAARLGRDKSVISREIARNSRPDGEYRAVAAQVLAEQRARRPKPRKLENPQLVARVQQDLTDKWSPEQIAARLKVDFPDDESMRASHETIYRALFIQGKGSLRKELTACLRTGRALRRPRKRVDGRADPDRRIPDKIMISERPAEADDRAVPGHWEGDLILGKHNRSAVGTLVERSTRFVVLLHLPGPHDLLAFQHAVVEAMTALPAQLRRSLAWDQGLEMRDHKQISIAADLPIYFCDPHSPWQRGTNENTNGLLRQYLPKGTDLSVHTPADLAEIARSLNGRPRKTLDWLKPIEVIGPLLSGDQPAGVASAP
ncbi:IS30 family transposase [Petropleomorpha daqingensis]|uniref:IS30 family transposase n=1 Tax=Petropleomorpha daqingensis TaxID=2026353 RepID=A0A853CDH1_9ACTN|nr:IS30 family transposase [Petropleomorpha daqingensis]NYJ04193.1 IS30 family transposase [Petropleomorpha daqingensis]